MQYQLVAEGRALNGLPTRLTTWAAWPTRVAAEAHVDGFRQHLTDPQNPRAMRDEPGLTIRVQPLRVEDED